MLLDKSLISFEWTRIEKNLAEACRALSLKRLINYDCGGSLLADGIRPINLNLSLQERVCLKFEIQARQGSESKQSDRLDTLQRVAGSERTRLVSKNSNLISKEQSFIQASSAIFAFQKINLFLIQSMQFAAN